MMYLFSITIFIHYIIVTVENPYVLNIILPQTINQAQALLK